jgi:hypothetical protein
MATSLQAASGRPPDASPAASDRAPTVGRLYRSRNSKGGFMLGLDQESSNEEQSVETLMLMAAVIGMNRWFFTLPSKTGII